MGYNRGSTLSQTPLEYLSELVKVQADGEVAVQSLIAETMQKNGCKVDFYDYLPTQVPVKGEFSIADEDDGQQRRVLIATAEGDPNLPSLLIFAHPDSESLKDLDKWHSDPFNAFSNNGKLFGWGVADDLAGCACAVVAIEIILSRKKTSLGNIIFASTPSKRYAKGVASILHRGVTADASLYLHPAESGKGMAEIKAVASGQLEFSVTVKGSAPDTTEPGHTAFSHLGINPIEKAIKIIDGLSALNESRNSRILHQRIHNAVGRSTNLHISRITANSEDKLSRLNETCTLGGAISFPPGEGLSEVKAEVENTIKKVAQNDAWLKLHYPKITWISGVTGGEVEENSLFYQVASSAIKKITGDLPDVNPMHTSSDIRNPIVEADIPCVGLGCLGGNLSQNNKVDEWIDINDFNRMVEVTSEIIERWCSGEQKKGPDGPRK